MTSYQMWTTLARWRLIGAPNWCFRGMQHPSFAVGMQQLRPAARLSFPLTSLLISDMSIEAMLARMCGVQPPPSQPSAASEMRKDHVSISGVWVHKAQALVLLQADQFRKLKQGRDRVKQHGLVGVRAEDSKGDGFKCGAAFQFQVVNDGKEGCVVETRVAFLLEIRKPFKSYFYPRMSVLKKDQATAVGVVVDLSPSAPLSESFGIGLGFMR